MLNRKFMLNRKIYFSIISILWTILNVLNMAALDMADRTVFLFAQSPNSGVDQKRLETDWIQQDSGHNEITSCFISGQNNETEKKLVTKVFKELSDFGVKTEPLQKEYDALSKIPGNDKRWKDLYLRACRIRRVNRLASLRERNRQIIFVKNEILTGSGNFQSSFFDTDSQNSGKPMIWNPVDSKLCLLTVDENGETALTTLCEQLKGSIRDPELSFDAKTLFFSMRTDFEKDNYQIYSMNLENRQLKQITHNPRDEKTVYPTANIEPCCLPNGRIFYISTRCGQLDPCSWAHAGNLYSCLADGSDIRRIGLDQVTVLGPKVLSDGQQTIPSRTSA